MTCPLRDNEGRIILVGVVADPQVWFMSHVCDPTNFDFFVGLATADQLPDLDDYLQLPPAVTDEKQGATDGDQPLPDRR